MNSFGIPARSLGETYPSRDAYLAELGGRFSGPKGLCNVLGIELAKSRPWLTVVLGGGSRPKHFLGHGDGLPVDEVVRRAKDRLGEGRRGYHGPLPLEEMIRGFLTSLGNDRNLLASSRDRQQGPHASDNPEGHAGRSGYARDIPDWIIDLTLAASRLNNAMNHVRSGLGQAPSRWGDDVVRIEEATFLYASLDAERRSLRTDLRDLERRGIEGISALCKDIADDLTGDEQWCIRTARVRLLAEWVWTVLSGAEPGYPGWTTLMLKLSGDQAIASYHGSMIKPSASRADHLAAKIGEYYMPRTQLRWDAGETAETHAAIAELLAAQSQVHEAHHVDLDRVVLPPPAAFLTTFDLELEMALLRVGQPFQMAIPFYLADADRLDDVDGTPAHPVWLGLRVDPTGVPPHDRLRCILAPPPGAWVALSGRWGDVNEAIAANAHLPTIVRLNGCPLIEPPDVEGDGLAGALASPTLAKATRTFRQRQLVRLVVIDDFDALKQSYLDAWEDDRPPTAAEVLGIPRHLITDAPKGNRYWMTIGVPLQDSSVRTRVMSLLENAGQRAGADPRPKRLGTLVNPKVEGAAQQALALYGFDVVTSPSADFVLDLRDIADHHRRAAGGNVEDFRNGWPCTFMGTHG